LDFSLFFGSLFLWGEGLIFNAPEGVDISFPVVDILINAPASILASIGLWKMKRWGYAAAQFVAGFYIYASIYIFLEVFSTGPPYPLEIIIPQVAAVIVAIGLIVYPWRYQDQFG
jgi:uncharacterized membrane protein (DUF2068 family)